MTNEQAFEILGNQVAEVVLIAVKNELVAQGHKMTGDLYNSIQYAVKAEASKVIIDYSFLEYGMVLNYGVSPDKVPYSPGSGAKKSQFIEGLKRFVEKRMGKTGKEAEGIAFAIARKMKSEGMPTNNSRNGNFSSNGKRLNWIDEGLKEANPKVVEIIDKAFSETINALIVNAFTEISKKNSENLKVTVR